MDPARSAKKDIEEIVEGGRLLGKTQVRGVLDDLQA
jgi:hypothetical protein